MKRLIILPLILIIIMAVLPFATTINIPADYPTIQDGVNAAGNGDTVLVQPGTYVENLFLDEQTVVLASLFLTTGDTSYIEQTIIDGNASGTVVTFHYQNYHAEGISTLTGFAIQNGYGQYDQYQSGGGIFCRNSDPIIDHNIIANNSSDWTGGGILCWTGSNPTIINNKIFNNSADEEGGGLWICWSHPTVTGNLIYSNSAPLGSGVVFSECHYSEMLTLSYNSITSNEADLQGSTIWVKSSNIAITNSTIANNISDPIIRITGGSDLTLLNTIVWDNDLLAMSLDTESSVSVSYSNIEDGWTGIGNINIDPLFRDPDNGDFHLMATECGDPYDSPCIDMGKSTILDSLLDCSRGLGTECSDMGAYGGGSGTVGVDDTIVNLPRQHMLSQNYPNPFNASTVIGYSLPFSANVKLDIYDVIGRHVETLFSSYQSAGNHQVIWNADVVASGIYFYKLQVDEFSETRKMFLVK